MSVAWSAWATRSLRRARHRGRRACCSCFDDVGRALRRNAGAARRSRACVRRPVARRRRAGRRRPAVAIGTSPVVGLMRSSYTHLADVGHEDVHVDEDQFQVGHLRGRCRRLRGRGWWLRRRDRARRACRPGSSAAAMRGHRDDGASLAACCRRTRRALRARGWSRGRARAGRVAMIAVSAAKRTRRLGLVSASASGDGLPSAVSRTLGSRAAPSASTSGDGGVRIVGFERVGRAIR